MNTLRTFLLGAGLLCSTTMFAVGTVSVVPDAYDFGALDIGMSESVVIEIGNVGDSALQIDDISIQSPNGDFEITDSSLILLFPIIFSPGASMTVEVTYTAVQAGPSSAVLQVDSTDPAQPIFEALLVGEGLGGGEVTPAELIEAIIENANEAIADGTLVGVGPGRSAPNRLGAFMNMLYQAEYLIDMQEYDLAAGQLMSAYKKIDGTLQPPDFAAGSAAPEIADQILMLIDMLTMDV